MSSGPRHARSAPTPGGSRRRFFQVGAAVFAVAAVGVGIALVVTNESGEPALSERAAPSPSREISPTVTPPPTPTATPTPAPTLTPTPTPTPYDGLYDPALVGAPYGSTVDGLLTFRGNPSRTYYGSGPVPTNPSIKWTYPEATTMCGLTTIGSETSTWCGTGWTGQPAVFERGDKTWTVFGAYDHDVHFVNADTGVQLLDPFPTGDIIKGSVTIDPDGYPLVYSGSRDDEFHIVAIDREVPTELWSLSAVGIPGSLWNNDWDGSALVLNDYLFEGGENSVFHVVKLNRDFDASGLVTVDPELIFTAPGYDEELLAAVGPNVSIENSVAVSGDTIYFANSGGLVQGWDVGGLDEGQEPERVFRYWVGDDVDATLVVDEQGNLYVGVERERANQRSAEIGQLVKLDPDADDPLVWSVFDDERLPAGLWATPALHRDILIAPTDSGRLLGVDRETGEVRWELPIAVHSWSSPVVVDDVLLQADCNGTLRAFDVSDTTVAPPELWSVTFGACIESTPAVWDGRIIIGTRGGQIHMLAD